MVKKLKERILFLLKLNNTPHEIALGVAIGVFIAITPLYGFHTIMVVIAALLIRRVNKIAILVGTNISIPPTTPIITWAGYSIGRLILGDTYPALERTNFKHFSYKAFMNFYWPLFLGSVVLGIICGAIFYFLTLWFIKRRKVRKTQTAPLP